MGRQHGFLSAGEAPGPGSEVSPVNLFQDGVVQKQKLVEVLVKEIVLQIGPCGRLAGAIRHLVCFWASI